MLLGSFRICSKMVISAVRMKSGSIVRDDYINVIQAFIAESLSIKQVHLIAKEMQHQHTCV